MRLSLFRTFAATLVSVSLISCGGGSDGVSPTTPIAFANPTVSFKASQSSFELANYSQTGRYSLPVGTGTNLLAEEASGITYNKDTDSLFVVGDGSTSVVQVTKQGVLINSMVLAQDASKPQGTYFYDVEGISYIGGGKFVLVEERYRQVNEFTYVPNTTLGGTNTGAVRTVKLGTTIGNIGIEGISYDPMTNGFIAVKESGPSGVFQTTINFTSTTASNGSPTADNAINLFDPTRTGLSAHNDVFALSNIVTATAADYSHIMILSAPDGKIVKMDRSGNQIGTLVVGATAQNEGMTMDGAGNIYVVSEVGGGPGRPELLVYAPTVGASAVGVGSNLYLTFNQTVVLGTGNVTVSNGAGDVRSIPINDTTQVKISGNTLMINPTLDLLPGYTYFVTFPAGLLKDSLGNNSPANSSTTAITFTTRGVVDTVAPTLVSTSPVDDATGITSSRILLNFNEPVVAGVGSIVISGGTDTRIINVTDITQVSFSGNTANINPSADFLKSTTYAVTLASSVIKDAAGNPFAGITSTTALNFTTARPAPPAAPTLLITEVNSNAAGGDFFELYNYGSVAIDLTGWKWDDDSANSADVTAATFPAVSIAPGQRLIVSNVASGEAAFRAAWGLASTVTVVVGTPAGPGLGGGDVVVVFDATGKVVTSFNFKGGTVTLVASDGTTIPVSEGSAGVTTSLPNHAGLAFGGTAISSAVWDGVSTSAPKYRAAAVGVLGGFAQPAAPTAIGSPGQ
jgi:uncharacterized protein YjiK